MSQDRRPYRFVKNPAHSTIHTYLARYYEKMKKCEHCGAEGKTDWAAKDHSNYTRDREDYLELCRRCHQAYDGRKPPSQKGSKISAEHVRALQEGRRKQREARTASKEKAT